MAHTPGPWEYDDRNWRREKTETGWYVHGDISEEEGEGGEVRKTCVAVAIVPRNATSHPICEDNARLVAAAPDLLAVALAYERWEADIIMDDRCWRGERPALTQGQFDRLLEIQAMRNAAKAKALGK